MKNKKLFASVVIIFMFMPLIMVKASIWDDIANASKNAVNFTAQKALDFSIKQLPDGVTADYNVLRANIIDKSFELSGISININKGNINNQISIDKLEVKDVDVVKALSGEETSFSKAILTNVNVLDYRESLTQKVNWTLKANNIEIDKLIPFNQSSDSFLYAEKLNISGFDAYKQVETKKDEKVFTEDFFAKNIKIKDFKLKRKAEINVKKTKDFLSFIEFNEAVVDGQRAEDSLTLFNLIKIK